jgi:hypothetical protein
MLDPAQIAEASTQDLDIEYFAMMWLFKDGGACLVVNRH